MRSAEATPQQWLRPEKVRAGRPSAPAGLVAVLQDTFAMTELTEVPNSRPTVLIVDDSLDMLRYLRLLLESDSYVVETATTGAEALRRVQTGWVPDVVLLDMQMPGLNGLQTLRRLRKLRPELRVIICSGVDDPRQMQRASQMGAHFYLTKPVKHLYLSAALERCLGQSAKLPADSAVNVVPISASYWH